MTRRTGERPIVVRLDSWSAEHPVARSIASGSRWFDAWAQQKATSLVRLSKATGIPTARMVTLSEEVRVSRVEVNALALAWCISAGELIASMPPDVSVVE